MDETVHWVEVYRELIQGSPPFRLPDGDKDEMRRRYDFWVERHRQQERRRDPG